MSSNSNKLSISKNISEKYGTLTFIIIIVILMISFYIVKYISDNRHLFNFMPKQEQQIRNIPSEEIHNSSNMILTEVLPEVMPQETQQIYAKYDEIIHPSSLSGISGYISRDQICFRNKMGDLDYMKKRAGCMACQVDNTKDKKYFNTNVITTCLYSPEPDTNDKSVYNRQQCIDRCIMLQDK